MYKFSIAVLAIIIVAGIFTAACSAPSPSSTPSSPSTGQVADAGKAVYASRCARCHGDNGQGVTAPAVIGANANLAKYNTGQGLLNFVSSVMPANAPGSLSQQDYLDVVTYLLVQNKYVAAGTAPDASQMANITLK